jgi:hypothetical protein
MINAVSAPPRCAARVLGVIACLGFALGLAALGAWPAVAQEGGWQEAFEDGALEGWELGPDVAIAGGALVISPGNFAARQGEFADFQLAFQARWEEDGALRLVYYAREESEYSLQVFADEISLDRRSGGPPVNLAASPGTRVAPRQWNDFTLQVAGGSQRVLMNGQELLSAEDPNPLRPGALVFINIGATEVALDNLVFEPQSGERPPGAVSGEEPPGEHPPGEPIDGAVPPPPPTPTPTPAPTGLADILDQLTGQRADPLQLSAVGINLALAALFAFILGRAYIHWGTSLSNRRAFAANFMLITVTTTFIILVVRSSVALSLGLVGALSIVRFRAAIKEPEELTYLFFAIGLGIGLGDNQRLLTALALVAGLLLIGVLRLFRRGQAEVNMHLTVASDGGGHVALETILATLRSHCTRVKLLRFDETEGRLETSFLVELKRLDDLQAARTALRQLSPGLEMTFLDNRGIG